MNPFAKMSLSDEDFSKFQKIMYQETGIFLPTTKKALVIGRISKRLRYNNLESFREYLNFVQDPANKKEWDIMINVLTTNETYFFREKKHFDYLLNEAKRVYNTSEMFRVWSAACSTGEEPYSIAMVLYELNPNRTPDITASDINTDVLDIARKGIYPDDRGKEIPEEYKKKYCLKGINKNIGKFSVSKKIKQSVKFHRINLLNQIPGIGSFDLVFLRNVLIYFDADSKRIVLENIYSKMKKNAKLIMGHSESIIGYSDLFIKEEASIYRKAD